MKHYSLLTVLAAMLFLLAASCGKKQNSNDGQNDVIELKPASIEISGEMEGCFTVIDRNYKVKFEDFVGGVLTVELVRTDNPLPFSNDDRELYSYSSYSASPYVQVGFGIDLLDEDGNIIDKTSASASGLSGPYSPDECVELVKLSEGKTGTIRFSISEDAKEVTSFRITSAFQYGGGSGNSSEPEVYTINEEEGNLSSDDSYVEVIEMDDMDDDISNNLSSGSKGTQNWDSLLDSYEKFANRYVDFYKKVKDGTITITSPEYAEYMQEAAEFAEKAQNAKGTMNAKQLARYNKITMKLASAIN